MAAAVCLLSCAPARAYRHVLCALAAALLLAHGARPVDASERYDPRLRFRTLTTRTFEIHFHQGEEALAARLAGLAESVATELEPKLGRPPGRVHVILVDQNDLANGWATPLPFNVIELVAAAPRGTSVIGNVSDWLRLVFVHEYTHILHLDRSRGFFGGLRRVFGRHPVLFPNIFAPPWQIEGLATYHESAGTGEGRVPAGDFKVMLRRAAAAGEVSLDRASAVRVDWPSGNTPYLYGAYFHEFLARRHGEASLTRLADATARRVPYLGSGAFRQVFGRSLGELWKEFEREAAAGAAAAKNVATRLTQHGFVVTSPAHAADGRLFYSVSNPHGFPALMERRADGTTREVATRVAGGRMAATPDAIVFDQVEYVRSVAVQSDLYKVRLDTGHVERLTRGARAADPDLSPDGRTIVCTIQQADRRVLATLPAGGGTPAILLSETGVNYASPRWSPDGLSLVAERQRLGHPSDIVVIDAAARTVTREIRSSGRSVTPAWLPDGRGLLFAADAESSGFGIHHADLGTGTVRRLVNAGENAEHPAISPDGRTLVFVGYTADGHDLFSIGWDAAEWTTLDAAGAAGRGSSGVQRPTMSADSSAAQPAASASPDAPSAYAPLRQLLPRFWTPIIETDGDDTLFGGATAGSDALGRHAYAVGAAWSTEGRPDWYGAYAYDRWRATLFADTSLDIDSWFSGEIRTRQANVGARLPFRTFRRTQAISAALHLSSERFECPNCEEPIDVSVARRAVRAGWSFRSARQYGFSISAEDGLAASAALEWAPEAFGSTGDSTTVVADVRAFVPAFPRHGVFALRAAGASSWGDDEAVRSFGAAGAGPAAGASFDRDAVALVRGFDGDAVAGRHAVVFNADYRVPLAWIERGVGTWPLLLRSVHGAAFVDGGAAWRDEVSRRDRRASMGVELSADIVVGYAAPLTIASGLAWRHDPTGQARGTVLFARIGRAF